MFFHISPKTVEPKHKSPSHFTQLAENIQNDNPSNIGFLFNKFGKYFDNIKLKRNKQGKFRTCKKNAVYYMQYIKFNENAYRMMVIDIDKCKSMDYLFTVDFYEDKGLPIPNLITHTTRGYQLFYFLTDSLPLKANKESLQYFNDVYQKLLVAFDADINMNKRGTCRNIFSKYNPTHYFHDNTYFLYDLNIKSVKLRNYYNNKRKRNVGNFNKEEYVKGNRNSYLFVHLLFIKTKLFYDLKKERWKKSTKYIYNYLLDYALKQNDSVSDKLTEKEVVSIVNSVVKEHYIYTGAFKILNKKAEITDNMTLKDKQQAGAFYTHKRKKEKTIKKIQKAINNLFKEKKEITVELLVETTKLCKKTIIKYYKLIKAIIRDLHQSTNLQIDNIEVIQNQEFSHNELMTFSTA
jgi:hypothetical protein